MSRVAVTGIGVVSPLGLTKDALFRNLMEGRSAIRRMRAEFTDKLSLRVAGEVDLPQDPHPATAGRVALDRFSAFALIAAYEALTDAGLAPSGADLREAGVYVGTGMGGAHTIEDGYRDLFVQGKDRVKPFTVLAAMNNAAAAQISLAYGLGGPSPTYSCACASSGVAIGEAFRAIRHGYASTLLAGGAEALLTYGTLKAWESLRTLAVERAADPTASCRPFARDRSGLVLGEGAAMVVLEDLDRARARGARILAELIGYGTTSDASHLTRPCAAGQSAAMAQALHDAGIAPQEVDYINAHGTATVAGDKVETDAIKQVFGAHAYRMPISSTKSMHGHLMGAAGALEFAVSLLAIQHQAVPPTAHLDLPDPECDLDYVPLRGRGEVPVKVVMSNSFGFGGTNAVLVARVS
jgi:3-oxoacyl-[acyl-carrier-protein] synthase II